MIEILHALKMIREVSGAVSLAWKPAQLWRIVKSADGTCVMQLRVLFVGLVHDRLDQVVILPQYLIRLPALHQVVQPSDQHHIHWPRLLKVLNFPGINEVSNFPPGNSYIVNMTFVPLVDGLTSSGAQNSCSMEV